MESESVCVFHVVGDAGKVVRAVDRVMWRVVIEAGPEAERAEPVSVGVIPEVTSNKRWSHRKNSKQKSAVYLFENKNTLGGSITETAYHTHFQQHH